MTKNSDVDDEEGWGTPASVIVQYEENEMDPAKFISYASCGLAYFAEEVCDALGMDSCDVAQLDCYSDTAEFIS